jgi:hypothetical protein
MNPSFIWSRKLEDTSICDTLIDVFKQAHQKGLTKPGAIGANAMVNPNIKTSTDLWLQDIIPKYFSPEDLRWADYHKELSGFIDKFCTDAKLYTYAGKFEMRQPPQLQWYKPGEGFKEWHIDAGHELAHRALVFMTYLNDVPNGGTEFMHHNITTPAEKGNTVIFPAGLTHIHRGQISQTHDKYILTGWLSWDNTRNET